MMRTGVMGEQTLSIWRRKCGTGFLRVGIGGVRLKERCDDSMNFFLYMKESERLFV
jgi:hypothetical protein